MKYLILFFPLLCFAESKGIIGELSWKEITEFSKDSKEYENSLAVGILTNEKRETCAATHIGIDTIISAGHCATSMVFFNGIRCSLFKVFGDADIAEFFCNGLGKSAITISNEVTKTIYILHKQCLWTVDPYCKPTMKYSPGEIVQVNGNFFMHTCDTLSGSSGSPIFNDKHELIGIHSGYVDSEELNMGSFIGELK
jgi:hypothetical protein